MHIIKQPNFFLHNWNTLKIKSNNSQLFEFFNLWVDLSVKLNQSKLTVFLEKWDVVEKKKQQNLLEIEKEKQSVLREILFKNNFLNVFWEKRQILLKQKKTTTPNINLFKILRVGPTEIRHSNFLSWLFDREETHLHKNEFLKIFLSCANPVFENQENLLEQITPSITKPYDTRREYQDMDISLVFENSYIIIENKINHTLQKHQPSKYEKTARTECDHLGIPYQNIFFILLSVYEEDLTLLRKINTKSYTVNYRTFFKELKKNFEIIESPILLKIVKQYMKTIIK